MQIFMTATLFLFTNMSYAKSNIVGVWIDDGNTLLVQVVDNPSEGPFTAGEIWQSIKSDSLNANGKRWVKTKNFELTCDGLKDTWGNTFGNCKILVSCGNVINNVSEVNFAISKAEGEEGLSHFIQPSGADNILIKAPMYDEYDQEKSSFIFEANWKYKMVAGVLDKHLVTE